MDIENYKLTNHVFSDVITKEKFHLYKHIQINDFKLISHGSTNLAEGAEVNGFYLYPFDSVTIKLNTGKLIKLKKGQFYNLQDLEVVTHRKLFGSNTFTESKY